MATIMVNPQKVKAEAEAIEAKCTEYCNTMNQMFHDLNSLKWTFPDGVYFIARINQHRDQFEDLQKRLTTSADILREAAQMYEEVIRRNQT